MKRIVGILFSLILIVAMLAFVSVRPIMVGGTISVVVDLPAAPIQRDEDACTLAHTHTILNQTLNEATGFVCVRTKYQGIIKYEYNLIFPGNWVREDGKIDTRSYQFFPNISEESLNITLLLENINASTGLTENDEEIWTRIQKVWNWLQINELHPGDPYHEQAKQFYESQPGWISISGIADMWVAFSGFYWGTCMSRAQFLATLLYRVGISPNRFAIAETRWKPKYSQHMYVILFIRGRWTNLDPTWIHMALDDFECIKPIPYQMGIADYNHPLKIKILPNSTLSYVPIVNTRKITSPYIQILSPPDNLCTFKEAVNITGIVEDLQIENVRINGITVPLKNNVFNSSIELGEGNNVIVCEIQDYLNRSGNDEIVIIKRTNVAIVINEILFETNETANECFQFVEIWNPANHSTNLYGYVIENRLQRMCIVSSITLNPQCFMVITTDSYAFLNTYPSYSSLLIEQHYITDKDSLNDDGNAIPASSSNDLHTEISLNRTNDWLRLYSIDPGIKNNVSTYLVDTVAFGNIPDDYVYNLPTESEVGVWLSKMIPTGYSIQRSPNGADTNDCEEDFNIYPPTPGAESPAPTIPGDINRDNKVDHKDLLILASAYGSKIGDPQYILEVDINNDGEINHEDLLILASNYGKEA